MTSPYHLDPNGPIEEAIVSAGRTRHVCDTPKHRRRLITSDGRFDTFVLRKIVHVEVHYEVIKRMIFKWSMEWRNVMELHEFFCKFKLDPRENNREEARAKQWDIYRL